MPNGLVSCLMVTANRPVYVGRAVALFEAQTYRDKELVIIDDGDVDCSALIANSSERSHIRYIRLTGKPRLSLGELRNISIDCANGDWCIQWDDDEWYHPERIRLQVAEACDKAVGASALKWTLMNVASSSELSHHLFRADSGIATPGTLLFHRDTRSRYQPLARNEDGKFMRDVRSELGLAVLGNEFSHLFIRVFHGSNTWDEEHFLNKLRRRPIDWPSWAIAKYLRGDLTTHKAFRLTELEREVAQSYLKSVMSDRLDLAS